MEDAILSTVTWLEDVDFAIVFRGMGIGLVLFWFVIVGWVAIDASDRFRSVWPRILSVALVLFVPLFGLLIYLVVRPKMTIEEEKWTALERRYLNFETAGLDDCPVCGYELMPNFVYCPSCGEELRVKCESCDIFLEPDWYTCPFCGEDREHVHTRRSAKVSTQERKRDSKGRWMPAAATMSASMETAMKKDDEEDIDEKSEKKHKMNKDSDLKADKSGKSMSEPKRRNGRRQKMGSQFDKVMRKMDSFVQNIGSLPLKFMQRDEKKRASK